ncbi:uncharacterized protein [Amphiura filiformis]|uniref:uncharacterized protein n=1 Tax=Amphiura filiformis TaxID=82378 RepID=UPI003B21CB8E
MQFLIQDYYANVDIRDYSGKKPKHYLKKGANAFLQQLVQGKTSQAVLNRLQTRQQRIVHEVVKTRPKSVMGQIRESFRHSRLFGGSADSLDDNDSEQYMHGSFLQTPPASPRMSRTSPRTSPRNSPSSSPRLHVRGHHKSSDDMLMPPPSQGKVRKKSKHSRPKSVAGPTIFSTNISKPKRQRSRSLQEEKTLSGITE